MDIFVHDVQSIDGLDTARFGGKATGLARMAAAGIPVPPAFVIGTDGYRAYREEGQLPEAIAMQTEDAMLALEQCTGKAFGNESEGLPLLVSVRSGAQISMPGMMDTVLNLGITPSGAQALARHTGNAGFAVDTFVRFWRMFSQIVLDLDEEQISAAAEPLVEAVRANPVQAEFEKLEAAILKELANQGVDDVSADPYWQLQRAVAAVFESWDSRRARAYRAHHKISDELGTAVTVQAMVFGNIDEESGSGVAFTRDPNTGEAKLYGEFLKGRQGEDLVSGSATPLSLDEPGGLSDRHRQELLDHGAQLEQMYGDSVDIEFTVEGDTLYFLQVRPAKRTAAAAVHIAVDLVDEGLIGKKSALGKVSVEQLRKLLRPEFEAQTLESTPELTSGIGASPGHAVGVAVLDADRASAIAAAGDKVVLLRPTTSPQDIRGMLASQAIVTARGGALSHAAVVSRALDVPCVVGCEAIEVDLEARTFRVGDTVLQEGAPLSVDGATGKVYSGHLPLQQATGAASSIGKLLGWADERSQAQFWIDGESDAATIQALGSNPGGLGPIPLTDLMIANGSIDAMIEAVNELGQQPEHKPTQERLRVLSFEASRKLLLQAAGTPVDLRLPNLGSPRGQKLISAWASLAPSLFLPMGVKGLYLPLLRGIADAARETSHTQLTTLVPGINDEAEMRAFKKAAESVGLMQVGAFLQSPAGLAEADAIAAHASVMWIDLREVIRTFYGFPYALSFGDDVFESYVADGYLSHNPRTALGSGLERLVQRAVQSANGQRHVRMGVECGEGAAALSLVADLYRAGLRQFSAPAAMLPSMRLMLGQLSKTDQ